MIRNALAPSSDLRERLRRVVRATRTEPLYDGAIRAVRGVRESRRDRAWHAVIAGILEHGVSVDRVVGTVDPAALPLVVCLWNRPHRLQNVLDVLAAQGTDRRIRLVLWNNNAADADHYRAGLPAEVSGALSSIELVQSPRNIGGLARFVAARLLRNGGYRGPFFMLDDDEDAASTFVDDLLRDWTPRSVVAWWAFSLHGSYWRRAEIEPGTEADHAGTGGTVYDVDLVADDRFFLRLPAKFAFLEDQWMTFVARTKGWRVIKGRTTIGLVDEELNQYHGLRPLKDVFYQVQLDRGERLLGSPLTRERLSRGRLG